MVKMHDSALHMEVMKQYVKNPDIYILALAQDAGILLSP